ncbi:hypothetical protein BGZ65_012914, partial [Modicella reniformis]
GPMHECAIVTNTGHSFSRMGSHPNLHATESNAYGKNLDSVMPRNKIKLTCFPNGPTPETMTLDSTDAMRVQLSQNSKVVIEITQPRQLQAFESSCSAQNAFAEFEDVPRPLLPSQQRVRSLRHTVSQPNLMMTRSTSSVLGRRRSVSPDDMAFGSSKKRRADSVIGSLRDDDEAVAGIVSASTSAGAAEAAATSVVANVVRQHQQQQQTSADNGSELQIVGMDHADKTVNMVAGSNEDIGLGLRVPGFIAESPTIEALDVAKASSYVPLEDQKEFGIDYSLFTRVETAGWRILIPPNIVASFRSEDFGLTLKPNIADGLAIVSGEETVLSGKGNALLNSDCIDEVIAEEEEEEEEKQQKETDVEMLGDKDNDKCKAAVQKDQESIFPQKDVMETEEEMDELEDE